jgi:hypothetical protein
LVSALVSLRSIGYHFKEIVGAPAMRTAQEYRQQAQDCLKLAKEAKDIYAKEAMSELAEEFRKVAELLEHQGRKH